MYQTIQLLSSADTRSTAVTLLSLQKRPNLGRSSHHLMDADHPKTVRGEPTAGIFLHLTCNVTVLRLL
jgi:hypothetical protein